MQGAYLEISPNREGFVAVIEQADEGPRLVVALHMSLEVSALGEALITQSARERLLSHVPAPVGLEVSWLSEIFATQGALLFTS